MKPIVVLPYSHEWPRSFEALKSVIEPVISPFITAFEHVGSTSVPGLASKPIIDIDIVVASAASMEAVIKLLETLGYRHRGDLGITGREAFIRTDSHVPYTERRIIWPTHHLYACMENSLGLRNHLLLRDYLRAHPDEAEAYGALKRQLALKFPGDMDRYIAGKTQFITDILAKQGVSTHSLAQIRKENDLPTD
ncbi:GrpB family protein [Pontibacter sp. G13]|uniref:GrpB family protein n=1 Tax=Pontibacter sp. G13 TaxID=3074898 RepID=UPI00288A90C2|nr:GrpB family protein [Pontibacter sp. G13]WNJ20224.1 GrpB family protein [Pontibacter sp. G13]